MSIDNIWPKKVEYTISIPSRAMAIGSACPINFLMVPLLKGLKMGKITVKLIEYYSFFGNNLRHGHSNDRVISEVIIPRPDDGIYDEEEPRSLTEGNPLLNPANNFMSLSYDRWEVEKSLQIPPSLTKCTQDATVGRNLKVRHKLSIVVALKNPNGHTSELRASLPVILYISPFVRVSAKYSEHALHNNFSDTIPLLSAEHHIINSLNVSKNKKGTATSPLYKRRSNPSSNSSSTTDLNKLDFNSSGNNNNDSVDFDDSGEPDNEVLFSNADLGNVVDGSTGRPDLVAPPNYGEHIYDKLWSDLDTPSSPGAMTPMGYGSMTPMAFGAMTPSGFKTPSGAATAPGGMVGGRTPGTQTPTSSSLRLSQSKFNSQLTKHLNELHLQRLAEEDNDGSIDGITESANAGGHPEVVVSSANDPNQPGVSSVPAARDSLQMDYFSLPKRPARSTIATPISPDAHHISRRNSSNLLNSFDAVGLQSLVETPTNWDNNSLSRVPSYGTATKSYVDQALLSPTYDESIDNSSSTSLNSSGNNNASLASQNPGFAGAVAGSAYNNSASSPGGVSSSSDGGTHISSPAPSRPTAKRNSSFLHLRFGGGKNMLPSKQGESHGMGFPLTLPEKYAHAAKNRLSGKDKSGSKDKTSSDKSGKSKVGSEKPGNNTSSTSPASTIVPSRIPTSVSGTGELEYGAKKGARQK